MKFAYWGKYAEVGLIKFVKSTKDKCCLSQTQSLGKRERIYQV